MGNVLTVISDKRLSVCSTGVVQYYTADVVSATDYSPFGAPLPGRTWQGEEYRYAFNGQEKDDEVSGGGNTMTAEFWEYDSRLGRRWNLDPKPDVSWSGYSVFANNPIFIVDPSGDTTYVYNKNGQYAYTIYDKLTANEIVFLTDSRAKFLLLTKGFSLDQKARIARSPNYAFARFTEQTLKELNQIKMYKGTDEKGGVLYIDPKSKEVHVWECKTCKSTGVSGAAGSMRLSNAVISESELGGEIIGYWHQHNLGVGGNFYETRPTEDDNNGNTWVDFRQGGNFPSLRNGGIGLIVTNSYITVYPLMNLSTGKVPEGSLFGLGKTSVLKPNYADKFKGGKIAEQYGTFRRNGLGHNNRWQK